MDLDVLITAIPGDMHAAAVSVALERQGLRVGRWYPVAYPRADEISFALAERAVPRVTLSLAGGRVVSLPDDQLRTFWFRRQGLPILSDKLHPADLEFALKSCRQATDSAIEHVSRRAVLSVNDVPAARLAEQSKTFQLEVASSCGFTCPATLVSNSPAKIKAFFSSHREVIFKPLRFASWESERGVATNYTTSVTLEDLPSEEILRSAPGIFQEKIAKRYELRVTVMGRWVVAAQLDSQSIDACTTDWRVPGHSVPVQEIALPQAIQEQCLALMSGLGLAFGCLDLIYTPDGEYVFLEVNQQGQFLWLEERAPSIPLLDTFAQFLGSGDRKFSGPSRPATVSFESVREEARAMLKDDVKGYSFSLEQCVSIAEP
jgi:glutathione synthase/RimK-type ligase-like ATP-grasp enzyme